VMSVRTALVAAAIVLGATVAHGQQGNLPTPVQRLPSYPPAVCVTPDWRQESCEDRNAAGWQCGNVKVTVVPTKDFSLEFLVTGTEKSNNRFTLKAKNELYLNGKLCITFGTPFGEPGKTEPEAEEKAPAHSQESTPRDGGAAHGQTISHEFFDGLKLIKESWIGSIVLPSTTHTRCSDYPRFHSPDDMLGGLWAFLDQMNCTWQGTVYSPIAPLAEFAVKLQPGSSWPAVFHIQPLDAVEPLGALEPIEHWRDKYYRRLPPGVWIKGRGYVVNYDQGGSFDIYKERWSEIARMDDQVEVLDYCASGCTVLTMYIPKDRLCFGERASLNFHAAGRLGKPDMVFTKMDGQPVSSRHPFLAPRPRRS
jgi:hypothetical protein